MKGHQVLFICIENTGCSQMAQVFAQKYGLKASSAGTASSNPLNPSVVEVLKEKGIDISRNVPIMLTPEMINGASLVVTMGCSIANILPIRSLPRCRRSLLFGISKTPWKISSACTKN